MMKLQLKLGLLALLTVLTTLCYSLYEKNKMLNASLNHAQSAIAARDRAITDTLAQINRISQLDTQKTTELNHALTEIDRLERDARQRLRINARCPTAAPLPSQPAAQRMDDAAACELSPTARQDYFALRRAIERSTAQLSALQDYIRLLPSSCVAATE